MRKASRIICPECGWRGITHFAEIWSRANSEIEFEIKEGRLVHQIHTEPDVDPAGVDAFCGCGTRWRLRGVRQITEIDPQ